jgi:hypothetical protein
MQKPRDGNGIVLFCKKCKAYRTLFSKYCNACNNVPVEAYINNMTAIGWKLITLPNGTRIFRSK